MVIWMIHFQCLFLCLSLHESVTPAKFQGFSKLDCVGLLPWKFSLNCFYWFVFEPFRSRYLHHQVSTNYEFYFFELKKRFHNWFWDPGIMNLVIINGVMDLQIDHSDDSRIQQKLWHRQRLWPTMEKRMHSLSADLILTSDILAISVSKLCLQISIFPSSTIFPTNSFSRWIDTHTTSIRVQIPRWDLGIDIVECQIKEGSRMSSSKSCQSLEWSKSKSCRSLEWSKSDLILLTLIQKNWYHVYTSEFSTKAMGFVMRCADKSLDEEKKTEHNIRIRRLVSSKECNGVKFCLQVRLRPKASLIPLFVLTIFYTWRIYLLM